MDSLGGLGSPILLAGNVGAPLSLPLLSPCRVTAGQKSKARFRAGI